MINNKNRQKGITLIALVITIIVLLILAGISISMLSGDNGILQKAAIAKENTDNAQIKERIQLAELSARTDGKGDLTYSKLNEELTKEFGAKGTSYNISDESENPWKITVGSVEYDISHTNTNTEILPGESGYAGGNYDDPYIPINFRHIGTENWNSGYTIRGNDGTENEKDEFVWVPCVLDQTKVKSGDAVQTFEIHLANSSTDADSKYWTETDRNLLSEEGASASEIASSVSIYGGFYISKYEAGLPIGVTDSSTITDYTQRARSQSEIDVWNLISRADAITAAGSMISSTTGAKSSLISGACWDTTLQWIKSTADSNYDVDSTGKGNYTGELKETGYYAVNNIYDMAGNESEWTTENGMLYGNDFPIYRGGMYNNSGSTTPASHRYNPWSGQASFRIVLYK